MAEASNIGANFSSYTGDPNLGGGSLGFFKLDTRPLEDLARFSFFYNKSEYDQRQKDTEKAAAEIADYMSYDLVNGIPKFSKQLQEKNDALLKYVTDNPGAINYKNRKEWTEYQRLKGDLSNDIAAAKLNETIFMTRRKAIEDEKNPAEKERRQKILDKDIEALNIRDRLRHDDKFDIEPIKIGTAPILEIQTTDVGKNFIGQATVKVPDMRLARNTSQGIAGGLLKIAEEQGQFGEQYNAATVSGKLEPVLSSQRFNEALAVYKQDQKFLKEDGTLDIDKIIAADNGIVGRNLRNIKAFNEGMRDIKNRIQSGYFKDNFGGALKFSNDASGLNESDYAEINIEDGYSPEEIVLTRMLAQTAVTPPRTIKIDQTDIGIKEGQQAIGWFNARTGRIQEDRLAKAAGVSDDMALSAKKYAEALMDKLKGLADAAGIITKEKLKSLTNDELKYLGVATTVENKFSLTPLSLSNIGSVLIENGNIKPFSGDPSQGAFGSPLGQNINIATIATNKLGDEMTVTTGKEGFNFNNLIPLYQSAQQPVPAATKNPTNENVSSTELSEDPADWKKEGNNWRYKDGRVFDSKGKLIKQ